MVAFFDRTNDAGSGARFDRTNNADTGTAAALGAVGTAIASGVTGAATGYAIVTLVDPLYTGPGSILYSSNFTGTPIAGATVRYPTTNGFAVLSDGSVVANTNTGAYACFYNEGAGDVAFTVNLDGHATGFGFLVPVTVSAPNGSAVGFVAGAASGAGVTATASAPNGFAAQAFIAAGAIATVTVVAPSATGNAPGFQGNASGGGANASATSVTGVATGAALAQGAIATMFAAAPSGTGNEFGRADASGSIPEATVATFAGRGRAQWGKVVAGTTIWTRVS